MPTPSLPDGAVMNALSGTDPAVILHLLARIAALLARPMMRTHPSHFEMLGGKRIRSLAVRPEFSPWLEEATAKSLGLHGFELPEGLPDRLAARAESRTAALIAAALPDEFELAACLLAGAIQYKLVSALVARAERLEVAGQLGKAAFQLAIREAFALYPGLSALAPAELPSGGPRHAAGEAGLPPLTQPGYDCLHAFVRKVEPGLQPLFLHRVPKDFHPSLAEDALDDRLQGQVLALLRRKIPGWNVCIG